MKDQLKLVALKVTNFMGIRLAWFEPRDGLNTIAGPNGSGKSSLLTAIEVALGGVALAPGKPIRSGADKATIVADIGDYRIERDFDAGRTPRLKVTQRDGTPLKRPQEFLSSLCGPVAFDPLSFLRLAPREQRDLLLAVAGLGEPLAALDAERADQYAQRTVQNNRVREFTAAINQLPPVPPGTPELPVSVADLSDRLKAARSVADANRSERAKVEDAAREVRHDSDGRDDTAAEVARLEREMDRLRGLLEAQRNLLQQREAGVTRGAARLAEVEAATAALVDPDTAPLEHALGQADTLNRNSETLRRLIEYNRQRTSATLAADALDARITAIDTAKGQLLADAKLPVDGLGFGDAGVVIRGIPFEQCSRAEQIKTSTLIAMRQNPKLRIALVRDGAVLDGDSMRLMAQLAAENNCQTFIEIVEPTQDCLYIEDGTTTAPPPDEPGLFAPPSIEDQVP